MRNAEPVRGPLNQRSSFSAEESALYSRDLLQALAIMATGHGQHRLAELLSEAQCEADRLALDSQPGSRK